MYIYPHTASSDLAIPSLTPLNLLHSQSSMIRVEVADNVAKMYFRGGLRLIMQIPFLLQNEWWEGLLADSAELSSSWYDVHHHSAMQQKSKRSYSSSSFHVSFDITHSEPFHLHSKTSFSIHTNLKSIYKPQPNQYARSHQSAPSQIH